VLAAVLFVRPVSADVHALASKGYVDGLAQSIHENFVRTSGLAGAIADAIAGKADTADLAPVAFSGNFMDLTNRPADFYNIRSRSVSGMATGESFYVDMDDFRFRAIKQSSANRWAVRVINNSGGVRSISTTWQQLYGSGIQANNRENLSFAPGAELNPDTQAGDLGFGKQDTGITHLFDHTNMRLYRWTVTVFVDRAVMVVERLH